MLAKLLTVFFTVSLVNSRGTCPDGWAKWKDEKCYHLATNYSNFAAAQHTCKSMGASLANVKEEEQQTFLTNYLFNISEVEMGVWIGGTRAGDSKAKFHWEDGTPLDYANWAVGSPTKLDRRNCVAMQSKYFDKMGIQGTWKDTICNSPLHFVCEKEPVWGLDDIKMILIETRKKLDETSQQLAETSQRLNEEIRNPVPIGYIYTQFPQHPVPSAIWPNVAWTDVTSQFAGKFFRAAGGNAAAFGQTQNADCPMLTQVRNEYCQGTCKDPGPININPGSWSEKLYEYNGSPGYAKQFFVTNPEIRPINTAIRIWLRSA